MLYCVVADAVVRYCVVQALSVEVRPKHELLQELNYVADELIKTSSTDQAALIRDPLADINNRSESLQHNIAKKMVRFYACLLL